MKRILLIILVNMLLIAFIYSTYVKSRKTTSHIPKGANVVSEENATPENGIVYGREYITVGVEIYVEEGIDEAYIETVNETIAMFPAYTVKSLEKDEIKIVLVSETTAKKKDRTIEIQATSEEIIKQKLIKELCKYTDRIYKITESGELEKYTDKRFSELMETYVTDKNKFRNEYKEIYEYFESLFEDRKSIEEIIYSK